MCNNITKENVKLSIDGANIRVNNAMYFDIFKFLKDNGCREADENYILSCMRMTRLCIYKFGGRIFEYN